MVTRAVIQEEGGIDHEEATYDLRRRHGRCSKDGKVEEHPLEPVRPLGACSESQPGEVRSLRDARPGASIGLHALNEARSTLLGEIKTACKTDICSHDIFYAKI